VTRLPISAARFPDLLKGPPEASAAWSVFSLHVVEPIAQATMTFSDYVVGMQISGTYRLRRELCGRSLEGWTSPGTMGIIPADAEGTYEGSEHSGTSRAIMLFVPDAFLSRVLADDWGVERKSVEIIDRFLVRDPVIEGLLTRLAFEAKNGSPSGSIYAESACEFLAHHIIHAHSSLAAPPSVSYGGLPGRRLKLVLEYIEENLARRITLWQLAELAGVGARHFERAFRQAMGVPPHTYVLQKRVATARHLLLSQPTLTIREIAARAGFSSSSHLAGAFRRETGYSPTVFRRLHSDSPNVS
jgi:AraC family transcriptional regulator